VDNFETAIRRDRKHKGYIIAFSFGSGAYEEAARVKREGLEIALVEVSTVLGEPDIQPRPGLTQMVADLLNGVQAAAAEAQGSAPKRTISDWSPANKVG
jgi:hypothetical protein